MLTTFPRYLYQLFLSTDANFRLKGRARETSVEDTTLSPGWAYFVESRAYLAHVTKYANQEEVSSFSFCAFDPLLTFGLD